jgi:hypothetical protein
MLSRSNGSEPAYFGMITAAAFNVATIITGETSHLF